jgi:large subunit ribosomal protein L18
MAKSNVEQRERTRSRRHRRVRKRVSGTLERPRLVVHRSLKNIHAQIVDDAAGRSLCGVSSLALDLDGSKMERARETGRRIAAVAKENGIRRVVFDRGGYLYHGRVKALAEGAREAGLEF